MLERLSEEEAWVPSIWHFEVPNVLLVAERCGRISRSLVADFFSILGGLAIRTDPEIQPRLPGAILQLARTHGLTLYDAAYLDVAARRALPLATRDKDLHRAARSAGVTVLET